MSLNIEMSKDGYKVLKIDKNDKKIYLGSKYNQKREIDKFISNFDEFTNKDNFIILGLSFGEHIQELFKFIQPNNKILIVEFNKELIEYCKNDHKIKNIINNDKVTITDNLRDVEIFIAKYVNELNIEKLKVVGYSCYDKLYTEESQKIYTLARNSLARIKINRNTFKVFGETFLENLLCNLKYIAKSTDVNELENVYRNKPAIIVSAGPSLIKNIDLLKGVNNALIISGGRTLGALVEREINPSCVGIIDAGEVSYKLVEPYIKELDSSLVYTDLCNEKIIKEHKGSKFFYTDNQFINEVFGKEIKALYGGGSVAHSLTNLAIYLGCDPIIFIGQDLAYTGERGHAVCSGNRWDEWDFERYKNTTDIYVKDIYGDRVRTSIVLNEYRLALEKIIKWSNVKFINATEGGANIEGAENRSLKEVLDELEKEPIISFNKFEKNIDKTEDMIKHLEYNLKLIQDYIKLCEDGLKHLKDFKSSYLLKKQKGVDSSLKKLNKIDKEIMNKNLQIGVISTVITKVVFEIENDESFIVKASDSKEIAFEREFNRSRSLYSRIKEVLEISSKSIEKTVQDLKEGN